MEEEQIIEYVKKHISEKRFNHSVGVMQRAEVLAKIYGEDSLKARKVAIAHDIAKEFTKEQNLDYIKQNNIQVDEIELKNMGLLHGKIGADIAKKVLGFSDDMCEAIIAHTTAKENMSMLSKILYAADKTELGRKSENYNIEFERKLADENIDVAIIYMIDETLKVNINERKLIHPDSILARNYLIRG